ncbi:hypothetical protein PWT90_03665 [Aphanocladium album]|nr:hypothetical protein PWT90_03665 [Aphanocladium album]
MTRFWARTVPRIGLSYPFVLHLIYAVAAYHIAFSSSDEQRKHHFKRLASKHLARGTAGLTCTTSAMNDGNCGAAYLGATLVCYCTFAAGPASPNDLMICKLGDEERTRWVNLVSGLRLIRAAFAPSVLFSGLMSPLGPSPETPAKKTPQEPLCKQLNQAPVQWQAALMDLKQFVTRRKGPHAQVCLRSVDELVKIFEGVYGDENGNCNVSQDYQFVLGWLYRLSDDFTWAVRSGTTSALAILAHFAALLKTMDWEWWLQGWAEHLCAAIGDIAGKSLGPIMDWPTDQILRKM